MQRPKNIVKRSDRNLALRLREARKEVGLSVRSASEHLPAAYRVSHSTIASYEKGVSVPPINVLASLASVYERPITWFLEKRESLSNVRYLNMEPRVALCDQRQYAGQAGKWAEAYIAISEHLKASRCTNFQVSFDAPDRLAQSVREHLNLDDGQPIQNSIRLLESFAVLAIEVRASFGIEGASAQFGDRSIVVINPGIANERIRFNAMKELAINLLSNASQELSTEIEKKAESFATALLLPDSQLREAFSTKSFLRLIEFKERFGISISVMINRADELGVIKTTTLRWLRSEILKRGWKKREPGYVWIDRAINFEVMLESAIESKQLTWDLAEKITSVPMHELKARILGALEFDSAEKSEEVISFKIS